MPWVRVNHGPVRIALSMAMPSALVTSVAVGEESIDQATTSLTKTSRTTAQ